MNLRIISDTIIDVTGCEKCGGIHLHKEITPVTPSKYLVPPKDMFGKLADHKFWCNSSADHVYLRLNTTQDTTGDITSLLDKFKNTKDQSLKLWWTNKNGLSRQILIQYEDGNSNWNTDEKNRLFISGSIFYMDDVFINFDDALSHSKKVFPDLYESQSIVIPTEILL